MQVLRKFIICFITLAVCISAFLLYRFIAKPPVIKIEKTKSSVTKNDVTSKFDSSDAGLGDTVIGETVKSEYKVWDENNKLKRSFGFSRLLHSKGKVWEVEEPYMVLYEKNFEFRLNAKKGFVRIEGIAGKYTPTDAQLSEDVIIQVKSKEGKVARDCKILLDDLDYTNERCEFTTVGPVKLLSSDANLFGKGMTLIYNNERNRIELLKISKLDELLINRWIEEEKQSAPETAKSEKGEATQPSGSVAKSTGEVQPAKESPEKAVSYYQCAFNENVIVKTPEHIISADKLSISNILFGSNDKQKKQDGKSEDQPAAVKPDVAVAQPEESAPKAAAEEGEKVRVTCDGPLIFKPVDSIFESPVLVASGPRVLDLEGYPVVISNSNLKLAECGSLKYDLDNGMLNLKGNEQAEFVRLNLEDGNGSLFTTGSVCWDSKSDTVKVLGPGKISMMNEDADKDSQKSEEFAMDFDGVVDLYLTKIAKADSKTDYKLKLIDIAGGMRASLNSDEYSEVQSRNAKIKFADNNQIEKAILNGNVLFKNDDGALTSNDAVISFAKDENGEIRLNEVVADGEATMQPASEKGDEYPTAFHAKTIDYDLAKNYVLASGPVELSFYQFDKNNKYKPSPVILTAEDKAEYFVDERKVVFAGSVFGKLSQETAEFEQITTFDADQLALVLDEQNGNDDAQKTNLSKLNLTGEKVAFVSTRKAGQDLLHKITLDCKEILYDAEIEKITAVGDGVIKINNRSAADEKSDGGVGLSGPCYALIENFSTLDWYTADQRILAKASDKLLHIGYVPLLSDGSTGQQRLIDTGKIQADFVSLPNGKLDLKRLIASDSVLFEEPGQHQFVGERLDYDAQSKILRVSGSERNPCMIDNNLTDSIVYNLETSDFEMPVEGIATIPLKPKKK